MNGLVEWGCSFVSALGWGRGRSDNALRSTVGLTMRAEVGCRLSRTLMLESTRAIAALKWNQLPIKTNVRASNSRCAPFKDFRCFPLVLSKTPKNNTDTRCRYDNAQHTQRVQCRIVSRGRNPDAESTGDPYRDGELRAKPSSSKERMVPRDAIKVRPRGSQNSSRITRNPRQKSPRDFLRLAPFLIWLLAVFGVAGNVHEHLHQRPQLISAEGLHGLKV
jgi:hypothetical protein